MRSLHAINLINDTPTQDRADTFVNNFYNYVTGWTQITMSSIAKDGKRNQLYGLYLNLYSASEPQNNTRPSGVEQAPSGFVKGSNNGNTKLTEDVVLQIKKSLLTNSAMEVANEFNLTYTIVWKIKKGQTWKSV